MRGYLTLEEKTMWYPWILYIMISVGPFTGHNDPDHITIHIRMQSEHLCRDAQQRIMFAQYTYQHLQPNLLINADCQPDIPVGYNNP